MKSRARGLETNDGLTGAKALELENGSEADKGMIGAVRSKKRGQTSESVALITAKIEETRACNRGHVFVYIAIGRCELNLHMTNKV